MVFQRIYVKEGIFLTFRRCTPVFLTLSILDFRNNVNLNKRLQRIMFSSSCTIMTIKRMLFRTLVLEGLWILARNVYY